jgi:serine/threonine protein kinase
MSHHHLEIWPEIKESPFSSILDTGRLLKKFKDV